MGQVVVAPLPPALILTATDRLVASNADGGLSPASAHVILLGEHAGQNLSISNVVVLGNASATGGLVGAGGAGSNIIGGQQLSALANNGPDGPFQMVGFNNLPLLTQNLTSSMQVIGASIGSLAVGGATIGHSVLIGDFVLGNWGAGSPNNVSLLDSIIVGRRAAFGGADARGIATSIIMGVEACATWGVSGGGGINTSVILGDRAATFLGASGTASQNVLIGATTCPSITNGVRNTILGAGNDVQGALTDNVAAGTGIDIRGDLNTVLGSRNQVAMTARNIVLGHGADTGVTALHSDTLVIGTFDPNSAIKRTAIYGDLASGSMVLGNSTEGTNRDLPGSNILKLLNGTVTGVPPVGGGFFYAAAGALHWVGSAGTDTVLAPA